MDEVADDQSRQAALQDLRDARRLLLALRAELHGQRLGAHAFYQSLAVVRASCLTGAAQALDTIRSIQGQLQEGSSGRTTQLLRRLCEADVRLDVAAGRGYAPGQAAQIVSFQCQGDERVYSFGECEELATRFSMQSGHGSRDTRQTHLVRVLEAARRTATTLLAARAVGVPQAQGLLAERVKAGADQLPALQRRVQGTAEAKRAWRHRLRALQASCGLLASLPARVAMRHQPRRPPPLPSTPTSLRPAAHLSLGLPEDYMERAWESLPAAYRNVRPDTGSLFPIEAGVDTYSVPTGGSPFVHLLSLFHLLVARLPLRSELLVCTGFTTAEDVDLFVLRLITAPQGMVFAVVCPETLDVALQQRFTRKLEKWTAGTGRPRWLAQASPRTAYRLLIIVGPGGGSLLTKLSDSTHKKDHSVSADLGQWLSEQLRRRGDPEVQVVTSTNPSAGKTRWIAQQLPASHRHPACFWPSALVVP